MAQDYILFKEREHGRIAINKSVFQSIAEISVNDVENAVCLESNKFSKPVTVKIDKNKLHIHADVMIKYGVNVNSTCEIIQNKIFENISFMTGYKPSSITVTVTGFAIV